MNREKELDDSNNTNAHGEETMNEIRSRISVTKYLFEIDSVSLLMWMTCTLISFRSLFVRPFICHNLWNNAKNENPYYNTIKINDAINISTNQRWCRDKRNE